MITLLIILLILETIVLAGFLLKPYFVRKNLENAQSSSFDFLNTITFKLAHTVSQYKVKYNDWPQKPDQLNEFMTGKFSPEDLELIDILKMKPKKTGELGIGFKCTLLQDADIVGFTFGSMSVQLHDDKDGITFKMNRIINGMKEENTKITIGMDEFD